MSIDLSSKTARAKLPAAHAPYYSPLHRGVAIGFRRSETGHESWSLRARISGRYKFSELGEVRDDFDHRQAVTKAMSVLEEWEEKGAPPPREVRGAHSWRLERVVNEYIAAQKPTKPDPERWAREVKMRCSRAMRATGIETERYADLRKGQLKELQRVLAGELAASSVNRILAPLKAAVAWVAEEKDLQNPWQGSKRLRASKHRERSKLPMAKCLAVAQGAPEQLQPILTCMYLTGCRPVAARRLQVGDVDLVTRRVWFRSYKGADGELTEYYTSLAETGVKFFRDLLQGRDTDEHVFITPRGQQWSERNLAKAFGQYRQSADLEDWESLYIFRHSWIDGMVKAGMPLPQIAAEAGTSVEYIAKNYFQRDDELAASFAPSL